MAKSNVLIIIDALGYEIASNYDFAPRDLYFRNRLKSVLGFSQAALTSIFTGKNPDEHGIWNMYSFDIHNSQFGWLRFLPSSISSERLWLRRLIDWKLAHIDRVKSYYSLYSIPRIILQHLDLSTKKDLFTDGVEGCRTILDLYREAGKSIFVRDYRVSEERAFEDLKQALTHQKYDLYILYTAELDSDLHLYGSKHEKIASHLSWYAEKIEELLSLKGDIGLVVLGDHGMVDVIKESDIISEVETLDLEIPEDYIPFYDSTMARFKVFSRRSKDKILNFLSKRSGGSIIDEEEKNELGINFGDGRYGDIIFLVDAGTIILPSYMGLKSVGGMHGYHPDVPEMYSMMLSNIESAKGAERINDIASILINELSNNR